MQNIIESHRTRVKRAKDYAESFPEKLSRMDLEAIVEFYLLEDIERLYDYRLKRESKNSSDTKGGQLAHKANMAKFAAIKNIFAQAADIARAMIDSGNYRSVSRAIPERALMRNAGDVKHLPKIRDLGTGLLDRMMEDMRFVLEEVRKTDDAITDIETHDANVKRYKGISSDDAEEILKAAEQAIAEAEKAFPETKKNNASILN